MCKKISEIPPESMVGNGQVSKPRGGQTVNAKKERELFASGLDRLLKKQRKIVDDYRALAEMLDGVPVGRLLDWVVIEEEAHRTLLINIIQSLKQNAKKVSGDGADGVAIERETMLYWVKRISIKEQTLVAVCRSLKSQACWENANVVDALIDALVMDSEKHQRFLSAVEKSIENLLMSRLQ